MRSSGFTLIELVAIIILLGVLTATVGPRFVGRSGFAEYALRDQIISILRFTQQRAMYDHSGNCYSVVIDGAVNTGSIQAQRNGAAINSDYNLDLNGDYSGLGVDSQTIFFDGLGNAYQNACPPTATAVALATATTISITQGEALALRVHPTGYVERL